MNVSAYENIGWVVAALMLPLAIVGAFIVGVTLAYLKEQRDARRKRKR